MSIRENLEAIRAEIDAAARETGRTGADITLVGASKMNDAAPARRPSPPASTPWARTGCRR